MTVTRRVTVERNKLRFSAAHMATFAGTCEPLHGHNYQLIIEVEGDLTADSWVWDFGALKRLGKALADELDHKFLLQAESTLIEMNETETSWEISYEGRRYVFPKDEVAVLPIDNSTAERISEYLAGRIKDQLEEDGATNIRALTVGVEEMPGQTGWYTERW